MDEMPLHKSAAGGDTDSPARKPSRLLTLVDGCLQLFVALLFLALFAGFTSALVISAFQFTWELIR